MHAELLDARLHLAERPRAWCSSPTTSTWRSTRSPASTPTTTRCASSTGRSCFASSTRPTTGSSTRAQRRVRRHRRAGRIERIGATPVEVERQRLARTSTGSRSGSTGAAGRGSASSSTRSNAPTARRCRQAGRRTLRQRRDGLEAVRGRRLGEVGVSRARMAFSMPRRAWSSFFSSASAASSPSRGLAEPVVRQVAQLLLDRPQLIDQFFDATSRQCLLDELGRVLHGQSGGGEVHGAPRVRRRDDERPPRRQRRGSRRPSGRGRQPASSAP